ncbi:hypothetical protein [Bdellovibrio sp. HCB2-146]|uniref:hypothetical protein n=1 Tax=Bdellovibrio sp. HCB2-146 TaxID=3394362 RepID=UPI0039BC6518
MNSRLRLKQMEQEQKKSLLIIKGSPTGLGPAEGFLRNRDWKVKATSNLKEALVYLVQEQPAFVMVSVDHPNKKVRNLPKVLTQAFPVCVIAFAEESSTASYKNLSASATEYLIYPPITGPAIERTVNKYYKDQQTKSATAGAQRTLAEGEKDESGMISIKGSTGFSAENAKNILAQMMAGDGPDLAVGSNADSSANSGFASGSLSEKDSANMSSGQHSPAYRPNEQAPGIIPSTTPGYVPSHSTDSKNSGVHPHGLGAGDVLAPERESGPAQGTSAMSAHGHGAGNSLSAYEENGRDSALSNHFNRSKKNDGPSWAPVEDRSSKKKEKPGPETHDDETTREKDSLIERGTTNALDKSCIQLATTKPAEIELTTNMACIIVESPRFSGYLITAMGKNKVIDAGFINKIQTRLYNFLKEHGEKVANGESLNLKLKQVPFMPWAIEKAEFMRKSTHLGEEVAMAFFPRNEIHAKFGVSPDEEMAAIQISEFTGNTPVNFNLYVHLPKNNKYVLYTPRGGIFYGIQKDRLSSQGISHLHVLKAEMKDLNIYRAETYLNETIDDFEKQQNPPKKAV